MGINLINSINYATCKARLVDTVDRVESRSFEISNHTIDAEGHGQPLITVPATRQPNRFRNCSLHVDGAPQAEQDR